MSYDTILVEEQIPSVASLLAVNLFNVCFTLLLIVVLYVHAVVMVAHYRIYSVRSRKVLEVAFHSVKFC